MPDIYLHLDGQQAGPYQLAQVCQLLSEGKATPDTLAWHQGLTEWSPLGKVLASFPTEPPPFSPAPAMPRPQAQKGMSGCLWAAIIVGIIGVLLIPCCAGVALGPITNGIKKAKESSAMQASRAIELAMFAYATDHNGVYPDGQTSTEVFQKLIDEKYVADSALFYIGGMQGKTKATSTKLTADNVCFDVTSGVAADSPQDVPVVFSTGYTVTYAANSKATPDPGSQTPFPGIAVAYKDSSARFLAALSDGTVPHAIAPTFDPGTKTYRQLKP